jgi:hypothetical protein
MTHTTECSARDWPTADRRFRGNLLVTSHLLISELGACLSPPLISNLRLAARYRSLWGKYTSKDPIWMQYGRVMIGLDALDSIAALNETIRVHFECGTSADPNVVSRV